MIFTGGTYYIGPGPTGISISGSPTVTFGPGLYYIYGGSFSITVAAQVTSAGTTFVLTASSGGSAGRIDVDPNNACSGISLSGPKTGQGLLQPSPTASQGLLFFQDPTAVGPNPPSNILTTGTSNSGCAVTLNGAVYTPKSMDVLQGNAPGGVAACTEFIFQSISSFTGNPLLDDGCKGAGITLNQAQIQQVYLAM